VNRREPARRRGTLANRISTGLTLWWLGGGRRQVPAPVVTAEPETVGVGPSTVSFVGVPSPGDWVVPVGLRPGWEWLPEHGALTRPSTH
jgi:hypothetical protein